MADQTFADYYQIESLVGHGAFATVYRALDPKTQRPVALKILHEEYSQNPLALLRFREEARLASSLRHPHIVEIYDYGIAGDRVYLAMELMEGGTLRLKMTGSPVSAAEARDLILPVCNGLASAHRAGIVHRDVKPENILFDRDGSPHLSDFGIARSVATTGLTYTAGVIGSAKYISPEQVKGRDVSPASDVYALGAVLFELLTGLPPFDSESIWGLLYQHASAPTPSIRELNATVPQAFIRVVEQALAKDPKDRFPDAKALWDALSAIPTASLSTSVEAPLPRSPVLAIPRFATAALFLASTAVSGFMWASPATAARWGEVAPMIQSAFSLRPGEAQAQELLAAALASGLALAPPPVITGRPTQASPVAEIAGTRPTESLAEIETDDQGVADESELPFTITTLGVLGPLAPASAVRTPIPTTRPPATPTPRPRAASETGASPIVNPGPGSESAMEEGTAPASMSMEPEPTSRPTVRPIATRIKSSLVSALGLPEASSTPTQTPRPPTRTATPKPTQTRVHPTATPYPTALPTAVPQGQAFSWGGVVEAVGTGTWYVGGRLFVFDGNTRLDRAFNVGDHVELYGTTQADNRWLVQSGVHTS
ncbi:MAG TPA: protein kinase [Chloroflexota bacterium]